MQHNYRLTKTIAQATKHQHDGVMANVLEELIPGEKYRVSLKGGRVVNVSLS
jgi:hypothetical protein